MRYNVKQEKPVRRDLVIVIKPFYLTYKHPFFRCSGRLNNRLTWLDEYPVVVYE